MTRTNLATVTASDLTAADCKTIITRTWGKGENWGARVRLSVGLVRIWGDGRISTPCGTSTVIKPDVVWFQVKKIWG